MVKRRYDSADGKVGAGGAAFNGSTSNVSTGDMTHLHATSAFSVAFWFKMPTLVTNNAMVVKWNWATLGSSPPRESTFYIQTSEGADSGDNQHDIEVGIAGSPDDGGANYGYSTSHPCLSNLSSTAICNRPLSVNRVA